MFRTFILIDDDPTDLQVMKAALQKVDPGIKCISFLYSEEAMWVLKNDLAKTPDYILMDLNMPVKSGLDCLNELRKTHLYKNTPIILTTSHLPDIVHESLMNQGATLIFEKPSYEKWPGMMMKILQNNWTPEY